MPPRRRVNTKRPVAKAAAAVPNAPGGAAAGTVPEDAAAAATFERELEWCLRQLACGFKPRSGEPRDDALWNIERLGVAS